MKIFGFTLLAVAVSLAFRVDTQSSIAVDTVAVGNPGNLPDPETGFGAVSDAYEIGEFEVTARQHAEFPNAVAETDT